MEKLILLLLVPLGVALVAGIVLGLVVKEERAHVAGAFVLAGLYGGWVWYLHEWPNDLFTLKALPMLLFALAIGMAYYIGTIFTTPDPMPSDDYDDSG